MDEILQEILNLIDSGEVLSDELVQLVGQLLESEEEPPIPENLTLLWNLAGGQQQAFVSYLREFPDPQFAALLNNPAQLASIIERLERTNPIDRNESEDGFQQAPLQSSNIYGFHFDPRTRKMQVRFQSGSVYEYEGIPGVIFNLFRHGNAAAKTDGRNQYGRWWRGKNPSLGAALNQYVKAGGYPYRRLR